jgi:hypothetical protein
MIFNYFVLAFAAALSTVLAIFFAPPAAALVTPSLPTIGKGLGTAFPDLPTKGPFLLRNRVKRFINLVAITVGEDSF